MISTHFFSLFGRLHECRQILAVQPAAGVGLVQGAGPGPRPEGDHQPGSRHHAQPAQVSRDPARAPLCGRPRRPDAGGPSGLRAPGGGSAVSAAEESAESRAGCANALQHCPHIK